jgi:RNA recognition motif-containing protein
MEIDQAMSVQHKLFIGSLPTDVTEKELRENFSRFGTIADLIIIKDKHSKKSRGFGFITFKEKRALKHIMKEKHHFRGQSIEVKPAEPKKASKLQEVADTSTITKIFVGGIPKNANSSHLVECFRKYGEILEASVIEDKKTNEPRGFGFVCFKDVDSVKRVMEDYASHLILGKWVECKISLPKSVSEPVNMINNALEEDSSEELQETPLKPVQNILNDVNKIQHLSVPTVVISSKATGNQRDLKSQTKVRRGKKSGMRQAANLAQSNEQNFDFGDFVADYEVEEDDNLNMISYDPFQIDSESKAFDSRRLCHKSSSKFLAKSHSKKSKLPKKEPQKKEKRSYLSHWVEVSYREDESLVEFRLNQHKRILPFQSSKKFQPSFILQNAPIAGNIPQQKFRKSKDGLEGMVGFGDPLIELAAIKDHLCWESPPNLPTGFNVTPQNSRIQSTYIHNKESTHRSEIETWTDLQYHGGVNELRDSQARLSEGVQYGNPVAHQAGFCSHKEGAAAETQKKTEIYPPLPTRICSEYLPSKTDRPIQQMNFTKSDNVIAIKDRRWEALPSKTSTRNPARNQNRKAELAGEQDLVLNGHR